MQTRARVFRIIFFIFLILIADQFVGFFLSKLYFTQKTGQSANLTFSLEECNADILIFGNSRAQHHYDSRILSDNFHMSCFNAGMDGGHSILLPYAQIKVITKRYTPKIIILELLPDQIVRFEGDYDRLQILLPYFRKFPELMPLIHLRSKYEKLKLVSAIYPYNSDIINILRYNTKSLVAKKDDFDGFVPLQGKIMKNEITHPNPRIQEQPVIDTNMVNALNEIITICKTKKISLYIVSSPVYHNPSEKAQSLSDAGKLTLDIMHKNQVNYIDYSYDTTFIGRLDYFRDKLHLNEKGAALFTQRFAEFLKN